MVGAPTAGTCCPLAYTSWRVWGTWWPWRLRSLTPKVPGGRQWYPLTEEAQAQGWPGVPDALAAIDRHLVHLEQEHPWPRTALLGFSQGAAMALEAAVHKPLAGVVACSGYAHGGNPFQGLQAPVLLIHGQSDPVVPLQAGLQLQTALAAQGCEITLRSFPGEHTIPPEALAPIRQFLARHTHS